MVIFSLKHRNGSIFAILDQEQLVLSIHFGRYHDFRGNERLCREPLEIHFCGMKRKEPRSE
ncbi:MAG: hypothetical protein A2V79_04875 [Betaproteobacteria bacterium RBG_16_56_24]|nr:MAG: hypothetical protein A2V79_04875 [Betaproteobacteria bacterium RBG_16_56_24]